MGVTGDRSARGDRRRPATHPFTHPLPVFLGGFLAAVAYVALEIGGAGGLLTVVVAAAAGAFGDLTGVAVVRRRDDGAGRDVRRPDR